MKPEGDRIVSTAYSFCPKDLIRLVIVLLPIPPMPFNCENVSLADDRSTPVDVYAIPSAASLICDCLH